MQIEPTGKIKLLTVETYFNNFRIFVYNNFVEAFSTLRTPGSRMPVSPLEIIVPWG